MADNKCRLVLLTSLLSLINVCWGQVSPCSDLDSTACILLQKQKSDLCSEPSIANIACKRFCGLCPLTCYSCPSPVRDLDECNTTMACPTNQTCMIKHLSASDGHEEYIMDCAEKETCDGLGFGFIGKRNVESRSVSLDCCNTDLCNMPTKPTPPQPTNVIYPGCAKDIVFVLDDSGSVGHANFQHELDMAHQVISSLAIGPNNNQVALLAFSSTPQIAWFLDTYQDKQAMLQAVSSVKYASGGTQTGTALDTVRTSILNENKGDRPGARNVVIVLTDGKSNNKAQTLKAAAALQTVSDDVISVLVGHGVDMSEINAIATDSHHVIQLAGFSSLGGINHQLLQLICQ